MSVTRREFLRLAAAAAPVAAAAASARAADQPAGARPERPNILFLLSDQHRADTVPWAGNSVVHAPALAALAERSFVFDRAYVTQPVCTPSRASLLTGTWPHRNGVLQNHDRLPTAFSTLGSSAPTDYATAYYGKWHLGDEIRAQHGFRDWRSIDDSYWEDYSHPDDRLRFSDYHQFLLSKGFPPDNTEENPAAAVFSREFAAALPERYTKAAFVADEAVKFLHARRDGRPFALVASVLEPHPPTYGPLNGRYDPADMPAGPAFARPLRGGVSRHVLRLAERLQQDGYKNHPLATEEDWRRIRANYYGLVTMVDRAFGRVLQALEDSGQADNTIVVYTSDHGDMCGDHGLMQKSVFFDAATRVPLVVHVPWLSRERVNLRGPFSLVDLMPTLADLLGFAPLRAADGRSRAGALRDPRSWQPENIVIKWNDRERPDENGRSLVTTDGWKLNLYHGDTPELYHLAEDPAELRNLAGAAAHHERRRQLTAALRDWQTRHTDPLSLAV